VNKQLVRELISAGVHFGHGASRWHPKMSQFIFAKRGKIHIIDVRKTLKWLLVAQKLLIEVVSSGKDVVFVGTKRQARKAVREAAQQCNMHYVSTRWLGGTLTNFRTIRSRVQRLEELEAMQEAGTFESESKKRASRLKAELRKVKNNLEGIRKMSRLPGAVVIVDANKEYIALHEARKLYIPTIGIIDTDSNPGMVDIAIPANDDSSKAVDLLLGELSDAVGIGKTRTVAQEGPARRMRKARSRRPVLARANEQNEQTEGSSTEAQQTESKQEVSEEQQQRPEANTS